MQAELLCHPDLLGPGARPDQPPPAIAQTATRSVDPLLRQRDAIAGRPPDIAADFAVLSSQPDEFQEQRQSDPSDRPASGMNLDFDAWETPRSMGEPVCGAGHHITAAEQDECWRGDCLQLRLRGLDPPLGRWVAMRRDNR